MTAEKFINKEIEFTSDRHKNAPFVITKLECIVLMESYHQAKSKEAVCKWSQDKDDEYYDTSCGEAYCLIDGTLEGNKHLYCPYCGGKINELNNK